MHDRTTLPGNLQAISGSLRTAYEATVAQKAADRVDAMTRIHARQTAAAPALRHLAAERRTHPGR